MIYYNEFTLGYETNIKTLLSQYNYYNTTAAAATTVSGITNSNDKANGCNQ